MKIRQSGVLRWKVQHKSICLALVNTNLHRDLSKIEIQHRWKQAWSVCNHDLKSANGQNENGTKMKKQKKKVNFEGEHEGLSNGAKKSNWIWPLKWPSFSETQGADRREGTTGIRDEWSLDQYSTSVDWWYWTSLNGSKGNGGLKTRELHVRGKWVTGREYWTKPSETTRKKKFNVRLSRRCTRKTGYSSMLAWRSAFFHISQTSLHLQRTISAWKTFTVALYWLS